MSDPVTLRVERAREELANGKLGAAVGSLGDVVYSTRNPQLLREMRSMAQEGLERSGFFGRSEWKRLLKNLDKQLARIAPEPQAVPVTE